MSFKSFLKGVIFGVLVCALVVGTLYLIPYTKKYFPWEGNTSSSEFVDDGNSDNNGEEVNFENSLFNNREINDRVVSKLKQPKLSLDDDDLYETIIDSIILELYEVGYYAFPAWAIFGEEKNLIPGVAYTTYEVFDYDDEENSIYECGFYQIVLDEEEISLSDELVEKGVFAIPIGESTREGKYLISFTNEIEPFSGIFEQWYFKYRMSSKYSIEMNVFQNNRKYWDEEIDLYDYNEGRYILLSNLEYTSVSAVNRYEKEYECYYRAREAYKEIVDIQNQNGMIESETSLVVFSQDILDQYILANQVESLDDIMMSALRNVELQENQYVMVSSEGVSIKFNDEYEENLVKQRLTNGIINGITSSLMIAVSIIVIVTTCGTATPAVVAAIVVTTSVGTIAYNTSNLIAAGLDIYYSTKDDYMSEAFNPLLKLFKTVFQDEKVATIAYHAWGIANSLVASFTVAAGKAVGAAITSGKSIAWAVTRSVLVSLAKTIVIVAASTVVNKGVTYLVETLTGNIYVAKIVGTASAIVVAFFLGVGLEKLDVKYNISYNRADYAKYQSAKIQQKIIDSIKKNYDDLLDKDNVGIATYRKRVGNFGEMMTDVDCYEHGGIRINGKGVLNIDQNTVKGIDGIYKFEKYDKFLIIDAKAGPSAALKMTCDGKQMCLEWVMPRLEGSVSQSDYYDILSHFADGKVIFGVSRINPIDSSITYDLLDFNGNVVLKNLANPIELITAGGVI